MHKAYLYIVQIKVNLFISSNIQFIKSVSKISPLIVTTFGEQEFTPFSTTLILAILKIYNSTSHSA